MLNDLALFLRTNVYNYRMGIDDDVADALSVEISNIERLLNSTRDCANNTVYYSNKGPNIFETALKHVRQFGQSDHRNQGTDTRLFWALVLVDSALLQALEYSVVSENQKSPELTGISVLNALDHAIVVGGASRERLRWIHQMIDYIEGPMPQRIPSSRVVVDCALVSVDLQHPITRYSAADVDLFLFQQMVQDSQVSRPFIIENAVDQWPVFVSRPWANLEYLRVAVGHNRLVPVELGAKYTDGDWTQELMPFGRFIDEVVYPSSVEEACKAGYLAQHDLVSQAHRLRRDFWIPDYTQVSTGRQIAAHNDGTDGLVDGGVQTNVWFGPKGTVSPLHYDKSDNLFVQVVGCKYFRFYSPDESDRVYAYPQESMLDNTSQVDVSNPDLGRYPLFEKAQYTECVVRPGDMLYIPPKWWHYVRSLSISASISFWF
ncbi:Lysine-specific demethylase 8 [Coemansia sp. RSA 486]|nr:Lysine-specific demethylase 8 [Coemansia sp. RSA 486]